MVEKMIEMIVLVYNLIGSIVLVLLINLLGMHFFVTFQFTLLSFLVSS